MKKIVSALFYFCWDFSSLISLFYRYMTVDDPSNL